MFPGKRVRPLRGELVAERNWIVIVEQDEVVANGQLEPGLDDEAVFHGARNGTHVHDFVRADEGFSGGVHFLIGVKFKLALAVSSGLEKVSSMENCVVALTACGRFGGI